MMKKKSRRKCEIVDGQRISCWFNRNCLDAYTVVFLDTEDEDGRAMFVGMSAAPFHPQGVGMHGEMEVCRVAYKGRGGVFDRRIAFKDLPADCQTLVNQDIAHLNGVDKEEKDERDC